MRVLHYIPSIDRSAGGVSSFMQLLARDLGQGCELHVLTHRGENELPLQHCEVHYMPYRWLPGRSCRQEFLSLLTALRPDVLHVNCCWMPVSALTAIWADKYRHKHQHEAWCQRLRIVYSPHGMLEPYIIGRHYWLKKVPAILLFQRRGVRVSDVVHATSELERQNILQLGWNPQVSVIPNCVQVDQISLKSSWQRRHQILFLSRIHPKKGINYLLEATAVLREELSGYRVIIAGEGEEAYVGLLKAQARQLGVEGLVQFVGPVHGNQKWQLYQQSNLLVLPTYSENFGIVVAESLASGTPVITTVGTPWQELNTQKCGWFVPIGTEPLVSALREFLTLSDEKLAEMGQNGRFLVEKSYASDSIAHRFIDLYSHLNQRK